MQAAKKINKLFRAEQVTEAELTSFEHVSPDLHWIWSLYTTLMCILLSLKGSIDVLLPENVDHC